MISWEFNGPYYEIMNHHCPLKKHRNGQYQAVFFCFVVHLIFSRSTCFALLGSMHSGPYRALVLMLGAPGTVELAVWMCGWLRLMRRDVFPKNEVETRVFRSLKIMDSEVLSTLSCVLHCFALSKVMYKHVFSRNKQRSKRTIFVEVPC